MRKQILIGFLAVVFVITLIAGSALSEQTVVITDGGSGEASAGEEITFECGVNATVYVWDFGDGTSNTTNSSSTTHVFKEPGVYFVNVSADGTIISYSMKIVDMSGGGDLFALIGAGLAVGVSGMGAGIGVGIAGASAAGATANQPKKFGKFFVFQNLAQTQAVYGLLTAILIMLGTGMFGATKDIPMGVGLIAVGAGLSVGIAGLSAIGQGIAASGSIGAFSKKDEAFGKGMVFSALPETQAIYGLLVAILLMVFSGMLGDDSQMARFWGNSGISAGLIGVGAGLAVGIAGLSAIGQGIAASAGIGATARKPEMFGKSIVFSTLPETQAIYGLLVAILLMVFGGIVGSRDLPDLGEMGYTGFGLAGVGAGLAVGIAGLGAMGQGIAASAGIGSTSRKPSMFGKNIVFSALPETQAIYGLLVAILLMVFSGIAGTIPPIFRGSTALTLGLVSIAAGLSIGIAGLSAIGQGIAASAGIGATARKPEMFGKSIVFSALPETQAIYGLLVAILLMVFTDSIGGGTKSFGPEQIGIGLIAIGAGLAVGMAGLSGIGQGMAAGAGISSTARKPEMFGKSIVFSALPETQAIYGLLVAILLMVFGGIVDPSSLPDPGEMGYTGFGLAGVGAGLAVGISGLSAIGQGIAASAGISSTARKPEMFGKSIVFSALPETQAIYGLLTAILLMIGTGIFGGAKEVPMGVGLIATGAGLAVGISGLSGIGQGMAAASSIGALAKKDEAFGKGMVFSALPETQAIYGLLVAILLIFFSGMFGGEYPEYYFGSSGLAIGLVGIGAGLAVGIAGLSAIGQGIAAGSGIGVASERPELFGRSLVFSALPETQAIYGILIAILLLVFGGVMSGPAFGDLGGEMGYIGYGLIAIGAGLSVGIAGLSAIGQGIVASSAIGSSAKKPELFGKSLVFSVLPETQAIYGLLIAILLLVFSGMVGGGVSDAFAGSTSFTLGLVAVGAGLATGIAGLSAIGQGIAASAGIGRTARKPEMFGKNIVFSVLPETQAIYGLLVAILLIIFTGFIGITRSFQLSDIGIGYAAVGAGLAIGIAGLSAIGQGMTASSGINATVKGSENFGKSVLFSAMSETFAIFGLLIAILIIIYAGIMR